MNKPYPAFLTEEMHNWLTLQHVKAKDTPLPTTAEVTVSFAKRFDLTAEQTGKLLLQYARRVGA